MECLKEEKNMITKIFIFGGILRVAAGISPLSRRSPIPRWHPKQTSKNHPLGKDFGCRPTSQLDGRGANPVIFVTVKIYVEKASRDIQPVVLWSLTVKIENDINIYIYSLLLYKHMPKHILRLRFKIY